MIPLLQKDYEFSELKESIENDLTLDEKTIDQMSSSMLLTIPFEINRIFVNTLTLSHPVAKEYFTNLSIDQLEEDVSRHYVANLYH